eukprot:6482306-Amphidinium_carterae.2
MRTSQDSKHSSLDKTTHYRHKIRVMSYWHVANHEPQSEHRQQDMSSVEPLDYKTHLHHRRSGMEYGKGSD